MPQVTAALASRRLNQGWIESFVEQTKHFPSPEILRTWAAISGIAGVLERKVWVQTAGDSLYPNLYVILVTKPGIGKTLMLTQIERLWREVRGLHVAPTSITRASLIDALSEAKRETVDWLAATPVSIFNSLQIIAGELGVLIPAWDNEFMNTLTAIYDGAPYDERRRTAKLHIQIPKPQLNILAATTPSYLNAVMPEGAWDQGFISRTILVYSAEVNLLDIFRERPSDDRSDLIHDLITIFNLQGPMRWSEEARRLVRDWHMSGGAPIPEHTKLTHYVTRRTSHIIKLCMIACASRSNDKFITEADVGAAFHWLFEAEKMMPDIFMAISSGGDRSVIEDAHSFLNLQYMRTGQIIPEYSLVNFLKNRVPAHNIMRMIEIMIRGRYIEAKPCPPSGVGFVPRKKPEAL